MSSRGSTPLFAVDENLFSTNNLVPTNNSGKLNITSIIVGITGIVFFLWLLNSWALTKKVKKSSPTYRY